jgi:hypothetical protein
MDAVAEPWGTRVGLRRLLDDLDRRAQAWTAPARFLAEAYRWDRADMHDRGWYPQGVTTSADAFADGQVDGRRIVVVSWYANDAADDPLKASRLSFVDITDRAAPRYRHVSLVEPGVPGAADGDQKSVAPVRLHVGGIAWLGDAMLVADTRGGLRLFDLQDVRRMVTSRGAAQYVLPQRRAFQAANDDGAEPFRFSFVSVDRTASTHQLVVGEYAAGAQSRRLMTLALHDAAADAPLALADGLAVPTGVEDGVARTQGALVVDGRRYASVGRGVHWRGSMWTWRAGEAAREHRATLAVGPEDLSYWPQRDEIWSASEEPGRRFVYAVRRSAFC